MLPNELHPDAAVIENYGGPTKLAEILGFDKAQGGVQRVQNWRHRGIPAAVKVDFPALFMPGLVPVIPATAVA